MCLDRSIINIKDIPWEAEERKDMSRLLNRSTSWFLVGILLILLLLAGCLGGAPEKPAAAPTADQADLAEEAARDFFEALHEGSYEAAVLLYDGDYEPLISMNPDLDPENGAELFAMGCQFNGFTCLRMGEVLSAEKTGEGEYTFTVQFLRDDGEVFVLGPCCGADETEMPPISEFTVRVAADQRGDFKVLDLPPYVP